jgi:hypothetical protein
VVIVIFLIPLTSNKGAISQVFAFAVYGDRLIHSHPALCLPVRQKWSSAEETAQFYGALAASFIFAKLVRKPLH